MLPVSNMENSNDLEEKLREAACVGHLESVKTLIESSNVQINGQNKVNGWLGRVITRVYYPVINIYHFSCLGFGILK